MLKVKSEKLLIIAAVVWLLAGINILRLGVIAITETELVAALLAVGVVVTFLLFHMMFAKLVGKQSNRIRAYGNEPTCAFAFFDVKGYIMMAIMMGGGIALREFGIIPAWIVAFMYTGIGARACGHRVLHSLPQAGQVAHVPCHEEDAPCLARLAIIFDRFCRASRFQPIK